MFGDGSSLTVQRPSPPHQMDLHSHPGTFRSGYWWGCAVSRHLQPTVPLVAGPSVARHGWLAREPRCASTQLASRSCLLFLPCRYGCLSWQIPNGKEERAGILLPAFNASVVTESPARGLAAVLPWGRLYLMFLLFNLLLHIQLRYMACPDFRPVVMYVSQSFPCLLLTRKSDKIHLAT